MGTARESRWIFSSGTRPRRAGETHAALMPDARQGRRGRGRRPCRRSLLERRLAGAFHTIDAPELRTPRRWPPAFEKSRPPVAYAAACRCGDEPASPGISRGRTHTDRAPTIASATLSFASGERKRQRVHAREAERLARESSKSCGSLPAARDRFSASCPRRAPTAGRFECGTARPCDNPSSARRRLAPPADEPARRGVRRRGARSSRRSDRSAARGRAAALRTVGREQDLVEVDLAARSTMSGSPECPRTACARADPRGR